MPPAVPVLLLAAGEPDPSLMHERRRLEGLARLLLRHLGGGELAQLLVNQRQQLRCGIGIAVFDRAEQLGDGGGHDGS